MRNQLFVFEDLRKITPIRGQGRNSPSSTQWGGHHIVDRRVLEPLLTALRKFAEVIRKALVGHVDAYAAYVLSAYFLLVIVAGIL
jgi:hypothetical protein